MFPTDTPERPSTVSHRMPRLGSRTPSLLQRRFAVPSPVVHNVSETGWLWDTHRRRRPMKLALIVLLPVGGSPRATTPAPLTGSPRLPPPLRTPPPSPSVPQTPLQSGHEPSLDDEIQQARCVGLVSLSAMCQGKRKHSRPRRRQCPAGFPLRRVRLHIYAEPPSHSYSQSGLGRPASGIVFNGRPGEATRSCYPRGRGHVSTPSWSKHGGGAGLRRRTGGDIHP